MVQLNDFIFSAHATLLALITLAQFLRYRKGDQNVSRTVRLGLAAALTVGVFLSGAKRLKLVGWLDLIAFLAGLKLAVTLTKYLPQIKLNSDRKSTQGFAIENILLDLTGGILSLLQLFVDSVLIQGSWSGVTGDWGKLGLGLLSIGFDGVLVYQHYALYGAVEVAEEQEPVEDRDERRARLRRSRSYGSTASRGQGGSSRRPNSEGQDEGSNLLR